MKAANSVHLIICFVALCIVSSCGPFPGSPRAKARDVVKGQLFDPQSAEFRNERTTDMGNVCGEVNAKNRMGGYVGFSRYIYLKDGSSAFVTQGDPDFKEYYRDRENEFSRSGAFDKISAACLFETSWDIFCPPEMKAQWAEAHKHCKMWLDGGKSEEKLKSDLGIY
jgi:hypothetical protein